MPGGKLPTETTCHLSRLERARRHWSPARDMGIGRTMRDHGPEPRASANWCCRKRRVPECIRSSFLSYVATVQGSPRSRPVKTSNGTSPWLCTSRFANTHPLAFNTHGPNCSNDGLLRQFSVALIATTALLLPLMQGWVGTENAVNGGDRKAQPVIRIDHVVADAAKVGTRANA